MRQIRTLCYHKVSDDNIDFNNTHVSISNFDSQMRLLKTHYEIVSLEYYDEAVRMSGPEAVAVSFDDGYADVFNNALPILEKYKIPATVFITTGDIDSRFANFSERIIEAILTPRNYKDYFELDDENIRCRWSTRDFNERLELYRSLGQFFRHLSAQERKKYEQYLYEWAGVQDEQAKSKRSLKMEELKKLAESPYITIGSHSVNHVSLKWISEEQQKYELDESKCFLENAINRRIDMFAYPWGSRDDYTNDSKEMIKAAGYKYAFTTSNCRIEENFDRYELPRWVVYNYDVEAFKSNSLRIPPNSFDQANISSNKECDNKEMSNIVYIGSVENDRIIRTATAILIWGYGHDGKNIYSYLKNTGLEDKIVAFGDNDASKQGQSKEGRSILSLRKVIGLQADLGLHIIVCGIHKWELCFSLSEQGLHNIHVFL